ncbi:telomere-capping, CST complex subunit-domain-containing protein [Powellomyces hirtus]|nr:telomere-capping, CST complex subunit-domain-containing protein [Powellomyces hirtus]
MGSTSYQQPMAHPPQQHGTILYISEIINSNPGPIEPKSVRVLGILVAFDSTHTLALIEHAGAHLIVDAALLGPFHHRLKSLLQFIGEVERGWKPPKDLPFELPPGPQVLLRARIVRNVDGLDLPLYDQALEIRRKFDRERATLGL